MGEWQVEVFRNRLLQLGTVKAPNAQEALTEAYNRFRLDPKTQDKVTITKLSSLDPTRRRHALPRHSIG